jgi:hypothetical protein
MIQFTYKLKLNERVRAKCSRHPRYYPEKDAVAGIRGGCAACRDIYHVHHSPLELDPRRARVPAPCSALDKVQEAPRGANLEGSYGRRTAATSLIHRNIERARETRPLTGFSLDTISRPGLRKFTIQMKGR